MAINILPVRVPIGTITIGGTASPVFMTPEFARSLSDILAHVGGPGGISSEELENLIKALKAQTDQLSSLVDAIDAATQDQAVLQAMAPEKFSTADGFKEVDIGGLKASMASLVGRIDGLAMQLITLPATAHLSRQLSDLNMLLALQDTRPRQQKNTVTGAKGGNAALTSLLAALAKSGIINDLST